MEVRIQIPDNCELIKNGDTYIVKEKKDNKPRSWEEFCRKYPVKGGEAFIDVCGWIGVRNTDCEGNLRASKNWCTSKEEAEAFLAFMQLRRLREEWVGNFEPNWKEDDFYPAIIIDAYGDIIVNTVNAPRVMLFPTMEMAKSFRKCFKDLCETAKMLL